jgi:hypothetical protein
VRNSFKLNLQCDNPERTRREICQYIWSLVPVKDRLSLELVSKDFLSDVSTLKDVNRTAYTFYSHFLPRGTEDAFRRVQMKTGAVVYGDHARSFFDHTICPATVVEIMVEEDTNAVISLLEFMTSVGYKGACGSAWLDSGSDIYIYYRGMSVHLFPSVST